MGFKRLSLPELAPKPEPKPLEPKVTQPEFLKIMSIDEKKEPIIVTKTTEKPDPKWKKILLDEDPISVTDITKTFSDSTNVYSGKATAQYNTEIVAASAGQSFEASLIDCWNNGASDVTVGFRFGTGTVRFEKTLASKTGLWGNLVKTIWRGPTNTALNIYSYTASPDLRFTVFGENKA